MKEIIHPNKVPIRKGSHSQFSKILICRVCWFFVCSVIGCVLRKLCSDLRHDDDHGPGEQNIEKKVYFRF